MSFVLYLYSLGGHQRSLERVNSESLRLGIVNLWASARKDRGRSRNSVTIDDTASFSVFKYYYWATVKDKTSAQLRI